MANEYEVQTQDKHPLADGPIGDPHAAPKVDAGDSGATVGWPHSHDDAAEFAKAYTSAVIGDDKGYVGHSPTPRPNSDFTLSGVLSEDAPEIEVGQDDADDAVASADEPVAEAPAEAEGEVSA